MPLFSSTLQQLTPGLPALPLAPSAPQKTPAAGEAFAQVLQQLQTPSNPAATMPGAPDPTRQAQAEKAAGQLLSNALILPMLKQLRRSPWSENTVFAPGIGEKAFGPQFDIQIADRIAESPRLGLKTALVQRLLKRGPVAVPQASDLNPALTAHARLNVHG